MTTTGAAKRRIGVLLLTGALLFPPGSLAGPDDYRPPLRSRDAVFDCFVVLLVTGIAAATAIYYILPWSPRRPAPPPIVKPFEAEEGRVADAERRATLLEADLDRIEARIAALQSMRPEAMSDADRQEFRDLMDRYHEYTGTLALHRRSVRYAPGTAPELIALFERGGIVSSRLDEISARILQARRELARLRLEPEENAAAIRDWEVRLAQSIRLFTHVRLLQVRIDAADLLEVERLSEVRRLDLALLRRYLGQLESRARQLERDVRELQVELTEAERESLTRNARRAQGLSERAVEMEAERVREKAAEKAKEGERNPNPPIGSGRNSER